MVAITSWAGAFLLKCISAQKVINLSGNDWTLQNLLLNISVPGSVPSQAHLDLYANQVIGDPSVIGAKFNRFS